MRPVLVWIGSYPVPTHDFFTLLGVLAGLMVFLAEARRRHVLDEHVLWVVVGALLGGALGAKLSAVWRYTAVAPSPTLLGFLASGGRSILGGLAGAYAGALLTKRLVGYTEPTGDLFAPAVALAMAVGRWGCFLTEQIGTPTALPWGIPGAVLARRGESVAQVRKRKLARRRASAGLADSPGWDVARATVRRDERKNSVGKVAATPRATTRHCVLLRCWWAKY